MKIGNNKNPKGKLYAKYCLRNLKNNGLVPTTTVKHKMFNNKKTNWTEREFGKFY